MDDDALLRRIVACCYAVHRELGPGYGETTYHRALVRELENAMLAFQCDVWLPVLYHEEEIDRVHTDFVVEQALLEVRAQPALDKADTTQTIACLRASGLLRGVLVNFGADEIQIKRFSLAPRVP